MTSPDSTTSNIHPAVASAVHINEQLSPCQQFALAEYNNLRMEILKMLELQSRLLNLIVIAFGTIITVGFQTENASIVAIHPILALILGICWLNYNYAIIRAADYIRSQIESRFYQADREGWEHYILHYKIPHTRIGYVGERAIFPGSSAIAVLAAAYIGQANPWSIAAIATATVATVATILLFLAYRKGALMFMGSTRLREARNEATPAS